MTGLYYCLPVCKLFFCCEPPDILESLAQEKNLAILKCFAL